jgi:hypothetical protein
VDHFDEDLDDYPELYSAASLQLLRDATEELVTALHDYTAGTATLTGRSSERAAKFARNAELEDVVARWNLAAFHHTGTFPVPLRPDEDDEDEYEDDEDGELVEAEVSVVDRWDLAVVDLAALLDAGRQAHRRLDPGETEEDAEAAVQDATDALYAVSHEAGMVWEDVPGVEVVTGARLYVVPDEALPDPREVAEQDEADVQAPPGRVALTERWR